MGVITTESLDQELRLARKIESLTKIDTFEGDSTREGRKAAMRSVIRNAGLEGVVFTVDKGRHVLMAQQFQKAYGEAL
jgi:hypothetical protein